MARNNDRGGSGRRSSKDAGRRIKKKPCALCKDRVEWVDYKDVSMLRKYMSDRGKIRARRVSGNCAQHQRDVAVAIKTARELVLLPYTQRTTTERPGGRGRGRDGFGGRRGRDEERSDRPFGGGSRPGPGASPGTGPGRDQAAGSTGDTEVLEAQVVELEGGDEVVVVEDQATGDQMALVEEGASDGAADGASGEAASPAAEDGAEG
jgi:small subunit ribosomal protein S18